MIEFKELKIKQEGNWVTRNLKNKDLKKTALFIILGASGGILYHFITDIHVNSFESKLLIKHIFIGGFIGFFITNSPCARGKC